MTLERQRFTTKDPAKLSQELDRLVVAVQTELRALERKTRPRFALADQVSGRAGGTVVSRVVAFDTIVPVNSANGSVDLLLPAATRGDADRSFIVERLNTANVVRLQAGTRVVNNSASVVTLPAVRAAYVVSWDGLGFWTVNDAS